MISLHVYLAPKAGKEKALEKAVTDKWIAAMAEQPGFLHAAMLKPFTDAALTKLGASKPLHRLEVVSFWESEKLRLEWVARPIHDQVFVPVTELAESLSFTLQTVQQKWGL